MSRLTFFCLLKQLSETFSCCLSDWSLNCPVCLRMANLSYIRNFCFSHSSKDELSYCLSTFEAAVEYINLGKLQDTVRKVISCSQASVSQKMHNATVLSLFLSLSLQVSGEISDKALFKERMSLLAQNAAMPIHCLFEVSCITAHSTSRVTKPLLGHLAFSCHTFKNK